MYMDFAAKKRAPLIDALNAYKKGQLYCSQAFFKNIPEYFKTSGDELFFAVYREL